jgi:hypothetical protein
MFLMHGAPTAAMGDCHNSMALTVPGAHPMDATAQTAAGASVQIQGQSETAGGSQGTSCVTTPIRGHLTLPAVWTAPLAALTAGSWRLFATFTPGSGSGKGTDFVLSRTVTVAGTSTNTALPKAATSTTVDGYTVTLNGELMAGMAHPLTVTVTRGGEPVTGLQPYLGTYAHLTAFHEGDSAFAHLHPTTAVTGDHGGPTLSFNAELTKSGNWRLFLQFQTAGTLHTAAVTVHVS